MYNTEKYIDLIRSRLSEYRFHHSMCVAEKARELAKKYGMDEEKAYLAGVLHDIMKEETTDVQLVQMKKSDYEISSIERNNKHVHHQISGALYVRDELGIDDEDIVTGIRFHTTGRADMTRFEMIIYLADFTSADRNYPDVDIMRAETDKGLFDGMIYSLRYTIKDIVNKGRQIHPDTIHCYNWVLENIEKENGYGKLF